jgi:hypothetical protein
MDLHHESLGQETSHKAIETSSTASNLVTEAGLLPSDRVVLSRTFQRYYVPRGILIRPVQISVSLILTRAQWQTGIG